MAPPSQFHFSFYADEASLILHKFMAVSSVMTSIRLRIHRCGFEGLSGAVVTTLALSTELSSTGHG